jgi:hypothetical protein
VNRVGCPIFGMAPSTEPLPRRDDEGLSAFLERNGYPPRAPTLTRASDTIVLFGPAGEVRLRPRSDYDDAELGWAIDVTPAKVDEPAHTRPLARTPPGSSL